MDQSAFNRVVRAWILHYDYRLPNDRIERKKAFIILLNNLEDHGYREDDLTSSRKQKILSFLTNPNHANQKRLRIWTSLLANDLEDAIFIKYSPIRIRTDGVTSEMEEKLTSMAKKAEETRALKKVGADIPDTGDEKDIIEEVARETFYPEITEEMVGSVEGPEVIWDKDFAKNLGLDDNE